MTLPDTILRPIHPEDLADAAFLSAIDTVRDPIEVQTVASSCSKIYRLQGRSAVAKEFGDLVDVGAAIGPVEVPAVLVGGEARIEVVADSDINLKHLATAATELSEEGWSVWFLVPLYRLGEAHSAFRDSGVERVQGYWRSSDCVVFGAPEVP